MAEAIEGAHDAASTGSPAVNPGPKVRNQTACDVCRSRKIRCTYDSDQQRCRGCVFLDVECTHQRPRRKRGPPNKHAHKPRKTVVNAPTIPHPDDVSRSPATHSDAHRSTASLQSPHFSGRMESSTPDTRSVHGSHWLSMFAPEAIIMRLLGDWFDVIHPLAPILLRRRFMRRLHQGEADLNAEFCGLVISVCSATKATLPRGDYGPVTVDYCVEFLDTHGLLQSHFARDSFSLERCIAMYNVGTSMSATTKSGLASMRTYHALSEAAAGARYLAYYRIHEHDEAEQQLLRRLVWLLFASACSADIFGRLPISLLSQDRIENFPRPLPLSDDQLEPQATDSCHEPAWHGDDTTYVPGLNSLSDLFLIWQEVQQVPKDNGPQTIIMGYLRKVQHVLDNLPPELRWRGGLSRPPSATEGHDVQIANLFVTSLTIRSNILQKFGPTATSAQEHQKIIDDLLEILYHLPRAVFDANGNSLVPKIRDIGAAYLEQTQLGNGVSEVEIGDARNKLERLLRKLDDLDCWQGIGVIDTPPLRVEI
ncbi:hypothetical protein NW762_014015 [Fusarium torreyae]|uniref:Zn(2)-C6 fungal-type domain-containing protein n=1 Tax=Fusarium torreyae TaxID=1237075 RepID=A0A9W8RNL4_9HYPO|nr:hypothetical protein NW762_014015 [Fusarium torreyae]